jgi:hypothetical protein
MAVVCLAVVVHMLVVVAVMRVVVVMVMHVRVVMRVVGVVVVVLVAVGVVAVHLAGVVAVALRVVVGVGGGVGVVVALVVAAAAVSVARNWRPSIPGNTGIKKKIFPTFAFNILFVSAVKFPLNLFLLGKESKRCCPAEWIWLKLGSYDRSSLKREARRF